MPHGHDGGNKERLVAQLRDDDHGQRRDERVYEAQGHDGHVVRSLFGRGRVGKAGCDRWGLTAAATVIVQGQRADGGDGRRQQQQQHAEHGRFGRHGRRRRRRGRIRWTAFGGSDCGMTRRTARVEKRNGPRRILRTNVRIISHGIFTRYRRKSDGRGRSCSSVRDLAAIIDWLVARRFLEIRTQTAGGSAWKPDARAHTFVFGPTTVSSETNTHWRHGLCPCTRKRLSVRAGGSDRFVSSTPVAKVGGGGDKPRVGPWRRLTSTSTP